LEKTEVAIIDDRQTDIAYVHMILYLSTAMHCIGQTISYSQKSQK